MWFQILFLSVALTVSIFIIVHVLSIHETNARISRFLAALKRKIKYHNSLQDLIETKTFTLNTIVSLLSIPELKKKLSIARLSNQITKVSIIELIDQDTLLIAGKFLGSEEYPIKTQSWNGSISKHYHLVLIVTKEESGSIIFKGDFPKDKNHDAFYEELFLKIREAINSITK